MNDQTNKLIEQLAQKLGTTTEYLWDILVKQAHLSALTDLIFSIVVIIIGILLFTLHKYLSVEKGDYSRSIYEEEDWTIAPMVVASIIWLIFFVACLFSVGNIINGFFNPEYWALKEILGVLK